jgi:hypothetical protein
MIGRRPKQRDRYTVGIDRSAEGHAVKRFGRDAVAEFNKARAVEAALSNTGFRVPHAIRCDPDTGQVEFEFLDDATLLQEHFEQAVPRRCFRRVLQLNDDAARLLGNLHQRLVVTDAQRWQPPAFLVWRAKNLGIPLAEDDDVYLHCDYSPVNLLVCPDDRIAVIDASPNQYFTNFACLKGHRLVDIATYTAKLTWPYRLRAYSPAWRRIAAALQRRFADVYGRTTGHTVDFQQLRLFESAVVRAFVEWKTTNRLVRSAAIGVERAGLHRSGKPTKP